LTGTRSVAALSVFSFKEAIRTKWLIVFTAIYFLVLVNVPFLILIADRALPGTTLNSYIVYLGSVSFPFLPLLSLPLGALSIVEEKESGTLQYLLCTRLTRTQFLLGRFLGLLAATSMVVAGGFLLSGLVVLNVDASIFSSLGLEAGLSLLLNLIMLSLALVISTISKRKVTALSFAIFTWFLLFLLSDFGASFGLIVTLPNGTFAEVLAALVNPVESAALISEMSLNAYGPQLGPTAEILKNYLGGGPSAAHLAVTLMGCSLLAWVVVTFGLMVLLFRSIDVV
jgi:Cu-processing system permease protein